MRDIRFPGVGDTGISELPNLDTRIQTLNSSDFTQLWRQLSLSITIAAVMLIKSRHLEFEF